jgi:hypothetical protein
MWHNCRMTNNDSDKTDLIASIEGFLRPILEGLAADTTVEVAPGRGRPLVLPAAALWAGLLVCVARGFNAQLELWRLLAVQGLWNLPLYVVSDDAVYKRLQHLERGTFRKIFEQVTALLEARRGAASPLGGLAAFASGVYVRDEMTLDAVSRRLPSMRQRPKIERLPGKVSALFDLRAQLWRRIELQEDAHQNEKVAARGLLDGLAAGSLILADLGYFAFAWFDDLTQAGYHWVSRFRAKTSYTLIHTYYSSPQMLDAIVWLGAYRADRAARAVRLVRFSHHGKTWAYLTNVLDPRQLSLADISRLYARRWDIERMFNLVKTHLKLRLLWSGHVQVIVHQVFAVFTIAQIILGLRAEIAQGAQVDVDEVSLDLIIRWLPRFAQDGSDPVQIIIERGRFAKIIRPPTRRALQVPDPPPADYLPLPDHIPLTRVPRYARKN